jgi:hypothetical protein
MGRASHQSLRGPSQMGDLLIRGSSSSHISHSLSESVGMVIKVEKVVDKHLHVAFVIF